MSLQLITGNSGAGKTHALLTEILEMSIAQPDRRFLVIVPEQFTMQTQKELVSMHPRGGILNIDILSFERLAFRVFDEVGGIAEKRIEEIGKSFLLKKIALDEEKNLPSFGKKLQKNGSIEEMKSVISELTQYDISPEMLRAIAKEQIAGPLSEKLGDICTVFEDFNRYLADRYLTAEEVPDVLCKIADQSDFLKGSILAFDGFTGFTPIQLKLIRTLLPLTEKIYVTVTFDEEKDPFGRFRDSDLFHMSYSMINSLKELTKETGVNLENPRVIKADGNGRFRNSEQLAFLEKHLFRYGQTACFGEGIRIFEAPNPHQEMSFVARRIARLVRENDWRYRDFAVLTGNLEIYGAEARRAFTEEGIPFFIDEKRNLSGNPFVEYLRAALEACTDSYSYDSIFRMVKTGLTDLTGDEADRLENYVLALGIRGKKKWRGPWTLAFRGEDPSEVPGIEKSREKLMELLSPLSDALAKRGSTVRDKTEALYLFCVKSDIQLKLKMQEELFTANGRMDLAREYAQVYGHIMHLLDKLVDVLGEEKIPMADYRSILEEGLLSEKIGIIPPGTDQVPVGDMERSRLSDVRVLFFVGMNEGLIPKPAKEGGVLTEADRKTLYDADIHLRPTPRDQMAIQKFYLYLSLTRPSEVLYLTCAMSDASGSVLRPAYPIHAVRTLFPGMTEEAAEDEKSSEDEEAWNDRESSEDGRMRAEDFLSRIERPQDGIGLIAEGLRDLRGKEPSPSWRELYAWYLRQPEYAERIRMLLAAAGTMTKEETLGAEAAGALYGKNLKNSASRLETFSACAFLHFAQYGLRLREREEAEFTGIDRGNILHKALELFSEKCVQTGKDWGSLEDTEREGMVADCVAEASGGYLSPVLSDSARSGYETERMRRLMSSSVRAMQTQLAAGDFRPTQAEQAFSLNDYFLKSAEFDLGDLGKLSLTGRIDRIDTCEADGREYVKVVDYKTGTKKFDMTEVYYGLQLQLVIYLNAAMEITAQEGKIAEPAGIFFYEIKDPLLTTEKIPTEEEWERDILRQLRGSGFVSDDPDIISHLDRTLSEEHPGSDVIPVTLKKGGGLSKIGTSVLSPEEFRRVMGFVNRKVRETARKILQGDVSVNPYQYGNTTPCTYCDYRTLCRFDRQIEGCKYRRIDRMDTEDVLKKMGEEADIVSEKAPADVTDPGTDGISREDDFS